MRIHPVFSVALLDSIAIDPLPGQHNPPPSPVIVDDAEEYEIEEILDSKTTGNTLKYLVKWVGYNAPTWETVHMLDQTAAVDQFHGKYTNRPGPLQHP
jgi:hypothetical protein